MPNHTINPSRQGFTMVELLVVIGLILFLMTISVVALSNSLSIARQRATQATILKVHGLVQQRIDAFNRVMEKTNLQPAIDKIKSDWFSKYQFLPQDKVVEVMVRKDIFRTHFPQNFAERDITTSLPNGVTYTSSKHTQETESAALLYWVLTSSEVFGVGPVDESEFNSSEIRDTDGDGLMEFVDGWGRPLRFYRWPTHLFRPGTSATTAGALDATTANATTYAPINRTYVSLLWSGLPAAPLTGSSEVDPLERDPDDPTGQLRRFVGTSPANMTGIQNLFHTPNTYHAFLIVSPGIDGRLGLGEPFSPTTLSISSPVLGNAQGRLCSLSDFSALESNSINDNITNRQR